jgi:hypothetical protein
VWGTFRIRQRNFGEFGQGWHVRRSLPTLHPLSRSRRPSTPQRMPSVTVRGVVLSYSSTDMMRYPPAPSATTTTA